MGILSVCVAIYANGSKITTLFPLKRYFSLKANSSQSNCHKRPTNGAVKDDLAVFQWWETRPDECLFFSLWLWRFHPEWTLPLSACPHFRGHGLHGSCYGSPGIAVRGCRSSVLCTDHPRSVSSDARGFLSFRTSGIYHGSALRRRLGISSTVSYGRTSRPLVRAYLAFLSLSCPFSIRGEGTFRSLWTWRETIESPSIHIIESAWKIVSTLSPVFLKKPLVIEKKRKNLHEEWNHSSCLKLKKIVSWISK